MQDNHSLQNVLAICNSFVDNLEFKDKSYRGYTTEQLVHDFLQKTESESAQLNMAIYVLVRDAKLLELRSKLEQPGQTNSNFRSH